MRQSSIAGAQWRNVTLKYVFAGALTVAVAAPALAADEYYIVRNPDKKCIVVDKKPTTSATVVVGNSIYKTRSEAESAVTTVCTD